jgi:hypothetical protein
MGDFILQDEQHISLIDLYHDSISHREGSETVRPHRTVESSQVTGFQM